MDSGDTLAIELEGASGETVYVLVPAEQALDLGTQVMVEAAKAGKLRKERRAPTS